MLDAGYGIVNCGVRVTGVELQTPCLVFWAGIAVSIFVIPMEMGIQNQH